MPLLKETFNFYLLYFISDNLHKHNLLKVQRERERERYLVQICVLCETFCIILSVVSCDRVRVPECQVFEFPSWT